MGRTRTHLRYPVLEIQPLALVLAEEPKQHAGVETRERHLADAVAVERLQLRGRVGGDEVTLKGVKVCPQAELARVHLGRVVRKHTR